MEMDLHSFSRALITVCKRADYCSFVSLLESNVRFVPDLHLIRVKGSMDTLVHIAAASGSVDILRHIARICKNKKLLNTPNAFGNTPLHTSVQHERLESIKFLFSCDVAVDAIKRGDWTPLMIACRKNNSEIVKLLLDAGANPRLVNKDKWNCLHIASRILNFMTCCEASPKALTAGLSGKTLGSPHVNILNREGNPDILYRLLNKDRQLWKAKSANGRTPLHTAALHGHIKAIYLLLIYGRYPCDEGDCCGITPLMDAAAANSVAIMKLLIKFQKASPNTVDLLGRNCLHIASQAGSVDAITFLVEKCHMKIDAKSSQNKTPQDFAVQEI